MSSGEQSIHSEDEQEINEQNQPEGDEENKENDDESVEKRVVKPKRIIKNPRPKLNVEVLRGPKGLSCLENCFENVKLKGTRGQEAEDLRVIMKTYEYWCHRLFPKYPFDECLSKIEKLGSKNNMQTYLKRIRLGMDDFGISKPQLSDEDDNDEIDRRNINSEFDLLAIEVNQLRQASVVSQELTEEQLQRIRLNKEKAEHIRKEKLKKMQEKAEMCISKSNIEEETVSKQNDSDEIGESSQITRKNHPLNVGEGQPSGFEGNEEYSNKEEAEHIRRETLKKVQKEAEMCISKSNIKEETASKPNDFDEIGKCDQIIRKKSPLDVGGGQPSGFEGNKEYNSEELNEQEMNVSMDCE